MKDELGREKKDWHTPAQTSRPVGRHAHLLELLHPASDMRSSTIAITVLCLISVTVSPISESWRCSARLRIPPRERRRLSSAYAQSLGELAKKEKERREKVTDESKVVTNDDLSKFKNAPVATGVLPPRPAEQKPAKEMTGVEAKSAAAGAAKENPDEPVDLQGRPESFWRQTLGEARQRVTELENEHAVLVLRINELRRRFFSTDDGFRRQAVQWELQKTVIQRDLDKEELEKAKARLEELEKEARRSGALPGWITPKTP